VDNSSFNDLIAKTVEVNGRFKAEFSDRDRILSLVSEVGELADAVLEYDGGKEKGTRSPKGKGEIADALADIFYNLVLVAQHYGVDLTEEYKRVLKDVEKRLKTGEFIRGE